jgi:histidine triad (HIT) family protein
MSTDPNCIFCKIVAGQVPSRKVFENEEFFAFHDVRPHAPVHFLVVPKRHVPSLADVTAEDEPMLGRLLALAPRLAREQGLAGGFKLGVNTGRDGGQEVFHLHLHVFGGK